MSPRCQLLSGSMSLPVRLLRHPPPTFRTFATSQPLAKAKGGDLGSHLPKHVIPRDAPVPSYPYGDSQLFKQADKGLYGGQRIQFGNNVSHRTKTKTRRVWKPNVVSKSFYSVILKKKIKLRVTTNVIKTMEREGGLDEYLLKDKETRIKELGPTGWALRWWLMQTPTVISRMRAEAATLGLSQEVIDENWPVVPAWRKEAKPTEAENEAADEEIEVEAAEDRSNPRKSFKFFIFDTLGSTRGNAYFEALRKGEVHAAGGNEAWLAKEKAKIEFGRLPVMRKRRIVALEKAKRAKNAERAAKMAARNAAKLAALKRARMFTHRASSLPAKSPKTSTTAARNASVAATKTKSNTQMRL